MRLEAIVASPPSAKCKVIIAMLEKAVSKHPDVLVLDIYFAGEAPGTEPTKGYQNTGKSNVFFLFLLMGKELLKLLSRIRLSSMQR